MIIFVTGTDTNIGKTFTTAMLTSCLSRKYKKLAVVKPIESGVVASNKSDLYTIKKFNENNSRSIDYYNFITFREPVAPLTAAKLNQRRINFSDIVKSIKNLKKKYNLVIVEGAGGVRVPITKKFQMIDLMKKLDAVVILVASPSLGTINHILLSVQALISHRIKFKGIIINRYPKKPNISEIYNPIIISQSKIKILGVIPDFGSINLKKSKIKYKNFFTPFLNGSFNSKIFLKNCRSKFNNISNKVG
tara:strand:- start:5771 stop:6514 length:744 start_codon:yes stop_codon:yes gene_type:complete